MLEMAKLGVGMVVIDPMCGSGTIAEIAKASVQKNCYYLVGDISENAVTKARHNCSGERSGGRYY